METGALEKVTVTEKAVREKIRNLKPFSAAGPDGIGPQLLQEVREEVIPTLTSENSAFDSATHHRRSEKKTEILSK